MQRLAKNNWFERFDISGRYESLKKYNSTFIYNLDYFKQLKLTRKTFLC